MPMQSWHLLIITSIFTTIFTADYLCMYSLFFYTFRPPTSASRRCSCARTRSSTRCAIPAHAIHITSIFSTIFTTNSSYICYIFLFAVLLCLLLYLLLITSVLATFLFCSFFDWQTHSYIRHYIDERITPTQTCAHALFDEPRGPNTR